MEDSSKLQVLYYNLNCVPHALRPVNAGSLEMNPAQRVMIEESLKSFEDKEGYVNVVLFPEEILLTPHAYLSSCTAQVLDIHPSWLFLEGGLVVSPPPFPVSIGTQLFISSDSNGHTRAEEVPIPSQGKKSLQELEELHGVFFPSDGFLPAIDIEDYPATIGSGRLRIDLLKLLKPYNAGFLRQVEDLKKEFSSWRKARGDGNCYFRAVGYGYLEHLCRPKIPSHLLRSFYMRLFLQQSPFSLSRDPPTFFDTDFYWVLSRLHELITIKEAQAAEQKEDSALAQLEYIYLHDEQFDQSVIRVLKLAAWNQLQDKEEEYAAFLQKPQSALLTEILTDGVESEGLVFQLMADVLDTVILHVLLPPSGPIFKEEYQTKQKGRKPVLSLLLRPGHYDILYTLQADIVDKYNFMLEDYSGVAGLEAGDQFQLYRDL